MIICKYIKLRIEIYVCVSMCPYVCVMFIWNFIQGPRYILRTESTETIYNYNIRWTRNDVVNRQIFYSLCHDVYPKISFCGIILRCFTFFLIHGAQRRSNSFNIYEYDNLCSKAIIHLEQRLMYKSQIFVNLIYLSWTILLPAISLPLRAAYAIIPSPRDYARREKDQNVHDITILFKFQAVIPISIYSQSSACHIDVNFY